jgi:hypothetical protein
MLEAWKPITCPARWQANSLSHNETKSMRLRFQERSCYAYE